MLHWTRSRVINVAGRKGEWFRVDGDELCMLNTWSAEQRKKVIQLYLDRHLLQIRKRFFIDDGEVSGARGAHRQQHDCV